MTKARTQFALLLIGVAILLVLPFVSGNYTLRLATIMMMYGTLAMAWNFIGGFTGYPSFGIAAFFGLGAYAGAVVQARGVPVVLAWAFAIVIGSLFAMRWASSCCGCAAMPSPSPRW